MDNVPLNPFPFSMNDSNLSEPFLLTFQEVCLQEGGDLLRKEAVKIDPVFNGDTNNHARTFKDWDSNFSKPYASSLSLDILKIP